MKMTFFLIAGLAVAPLHAQGNLTTTNIQRYYMPVRLFLQGAADVMPADKYHFTLAPEQMDFGQWINHSTERNYLDCATLRGDPNSNAPDVRLAMIERMAGQMRQRTPEGERFQVNDTHWLRVSKDAVVEDRFLANAFEAGYVWDVHMVSVGSKQMRKPKKDGWFEHGMNCAEYLELNFGSVPKPEPEPASLPPPHRPRSCWG